MLDKQFAVAYTIDKRITANHNRVNIMSTTHTVTHRLADGTYTAMVHHDGNHQSITRIIHPDGATIYRDRQAVKMRLCTPSSPVITLCDFARDAHPEYTGPSDFMGAVWDSYTARVYVAA